MSKFIANAEVVALAAMKAINPVLADRYSLLIRFLAIEPDAASKMRGSHSPEIGTEAYIRGQATGFSASRLPKSPEPPSTVPDELVSFILNQYFEVPEASLPRAKQEHLLSMAAENMVGDLLERYLASILEPQGWIWCSGSMVRAVDFVKPPMEIGGTWVTLQVKNRDNSENSSSSAIRHGTTIEKWFRTFSRKVGANWAAFPDAASRPLLSEKAFREFVGDYLKALKK